MGIENDASLEYHLRELEIAQDPDNPHRSLPSLPEGCRRVLDVGCGVGQTLVALNLPPDVEAHGVDIDAKAVSYGQDHFPALQLRVASGHALPYPNEYFDLVLCRVALPYMHVPRALAEFHRVLQRGGQLWLTRHSLGMFLSDMAKAARAVQPKQILYRGYTLANSFLPLLGMQLRFPFNRERIESYQPQWVLRRVLRRAGFEGVTMWNRNGVAHVTAVRRRGA